MPSSSASEPPPKRPSDAAEHVTRAHQLLQELRQKVGEHPELREAIVKLEIALSILTVKTGGLI